MMKAYTLIALLFVASISSAQEYDPVAQKGAMVISGNARFTVLSDRLIRMEYSPAALFKDFASLTFVNRNLPVPAFQTEHKDGALIIRTKFLTLSYKENSGQFTAKNLSIEYSDPSHHLTWSPGKKDKQNLKGTTRTLDGVSGQFSYGNMKKIKLDDGILSRSGWAVIDDSGKPEFDHSDWPWVQASATPDNSDLYFFGYGSDYKTALYDYVSVSGRMSMPPRFAFGIWYSKYWKYTEQDFRDIVSGYETSGIPLDVLVIDMDWHQTEQSNPELFSRYTPKPNGWTGFTWEKKYFPDYKKFLAWTNEKKVQTCMNIHPAAGVQAHEAAYPAFAKAMNVDTTNHPAIPFDITNKKFAQNYFDILLHPYEKDGVDFWWLDWQQWGSTAIKGVNPTFYLNYVHFSDMQRQGKRPLIFHRYGGLGNQRYQIGFSGDYFINWKSLKYQPEFTATASNVGFGYWSHDIGGHMNPISKADRMNPELFTRCVEWGAFSPIFRTHATQMADIERRIWKYPTPYFDAMKKALLLRYSLLPYIYTYSRFAYDSGVSLIRPMYYDYPERDIAYEQPQQYLFGPDMIVAPITASLKGGSTVEQSIWLPEGKWYDHRDDKPVQGGKVIKDFFKLDEVPIYIKAGSIIPSRPVRMKITDDVMDTVILTVYPADKASLKLYEDDGVSEGYRKDAYSVTDITYVQSTENTILSITPDQKHFDGQVSERCYEIKIADCSPQSKVYINDTEYTGTYDAKQRILTIRTARVNAKSSIHIRISKA